MKVGDLVQWTKAEEIYHACCSHPAMENLTEHRKRGIIVDNNGYMLFIRWENGDFKASKPNMIEVISEGKQAPKTW